MLDPRYHYYKKTPITSSSSSGDGNSDSNGGSGNGSSEKQDNDAAAALSTYYIPVTRSGVLPIAKPIALLDISKPGGSTVLDRVAARLQEAFPSIKLRRYTKPTFSRPASQSLLGEIGLTCGAAILALAD
eukprot:UC1_evm1s1335